MLAYVPQENTLISGTVADNLRTGKSDATEEEMWDALEIADGDSLVRELEQGLYTRIGENGAGLSEGQAQRIAIARALSKGPDPHFGRSHIRPGCKNGRTRHTPPERVRQAAYLRGDYTSQIPSGVLHPRNRRAGRVDYGTGAYSGRMG
jgi:hypothetical protein